MDQLPPVLLTGCSFTEVDDLDKGAHHKPVGFSPDER